MVTIAVYTYFISTLFGRQYLQPSHFLLDPSGSYRSLYRKGRLTKACATKYVKLYELL